MLVKYTDEVKHFFRILSKARGCLKREVVLAGAKVERFLNPLQKLTVYIQVGRPLLRPLCEAELQNQSSSD